MAFKMKKPVFKNEHTMEGSKPTAPKKETTVEQKLKRFETLEKMKNRTPEQEAEMKKLGRWLDNYYKDDNRG
tara:strand:+ start:200 stop:415 length:216 start_codon:yes stop_codon:yes gene_type:complete